MSKSKTKTRNGAETRRLKLHPGEFIEGRPVKPGDTLVRYGDGALVDVLAFRGRLGDYRTVRLQSRKTGRIGERGADQLRKAFFRAPTSYARSFSSTYP